MTILNKNLVANLEKKVFLKIMRRFLKIARFLMNSYLLKLLEEPKEFVDLLRIEYHLNLLFYGKIIRASLEQHSGFAAIWTLPRCRGGFAIMISTLSKAHFAKRITSRALILPMAKAKFCLR
jgi:hypothetical protein